MSSKNQNKPAGKSGQRKTKGEQRRQKLDPQQSPKPDQLKSPEPDQLQSAELAPAPDATEPIDAVAASPDAAPIGAVAPANAAPISLQVIANAYGDYTRKSLEETRSFFEKLTGARSLDKAMEVQTEFVKRAYQTFVTESQKMRELHNELARQTLKPLEGFVTKARRDERKA
jgi:hypothetical protein